MYRILVSIIFAALGMFSRSALAWDCTAETPSTSVSPPNVTISRDLPVGAVIGTPVTTSLIYAFRCFNDEHGIINNQTYGVKASGTFHSVMNGRRIYKTNILGIGYSISGSTNNCAGGTGIVSGDNIINGDVNTVKLCENTTGMVNPTLTGTVTVTYYKTSTQISSGRVEGSNVGALVLLNNSMLWYPTGGSAINTNGFTVTTPACQLVTESIPVNMREVDKNAFSGKDSSPSESYTQQFTLPMTCNAGTKVNVKMEGNIYNATKGVINVTGGRDAATGVGIQLLYNNQPMPLGSDVPVGTSTVGGGFTVPLKARYYQTEDRITTGSANGVLSFTMTYQ